MPKTKHGGVQSSLASLVEGCKQLFRVRSPGEFKNGVMRAPRTLHAPHKTYSYLLLVKRRIEMKQNHL